MFVQTKNKRNTNKKFEVYVCCSAFSTSETFTVFEANSK